MTTRLHPISRRESFLDGWGKRSHLGLPPSNVVVPEPCQELLEHRVELWGRVIPPDDGVAEPQQTLQAW